MCPDSVGSGERLGAMVGVVELQCCDDSGGDSFGGDHGGSMTVVIFMMVVKVRVMEWLTEVEVYIPVARGRPGRYNEGGDVGDIDDACDEGGGVTVVR